jgi:hypothetical protein
MTPSLAWTDVAVQPGPKAQCPRCLDDRPAAGPRTYARLPPNVEYHFEYHFWVLRRNGWIVRVTPTPHNSLLRHEEKHSETGLSQLDTVGVVRGSVGAEPFVSAGKYAAILREPSCSGNHDPRIPGDPTSQVPRILELDPHADLDLVDVMPAVSGAVVHSLGQ